MEVGASVTGACGPRAFPSTSSSNRHVSKAYGYVRIRILFAFTLSVSVRVLRPPSVPSSEAAALKPIPTDFSSPHEQNVLFNLPTAKPFRRLHRREFHMFHIPGGSLPRLVTWGCLPEQPGDAGHFGRLFCLCRPDTASRTVSECRNRVRRDMYPYPYVRNMPVLLHHHHLLLLLLLI